MAPLDFSGYVPGIPNMGPRYTPPSIIQLIQALQNEIKIIKKQLEGMASETDLEALSQQVDGLDDTIGTLSGDVGALDGRLDTAEQDIDDLGYYKEDKSNKVGTIVTPVTDTALYPAPRRSPLSCRMLRRISVTIWRTWRPWRSQKRTVGPSMGTIISDRRS